MNDLVNKTKSGLFYKFAERVGAQSVNFIVTIILARILLPEEFGVIALVSVFITILDVFVTYGFGNSLIADKKSDNIDFSTCFYFGLIFSLFVYIITFLCAPYLSIYFDNDKLTSLIRVMALRIPIAAVNSVQQAYVSKHMIFRKFFISTSIGTISSGVISIIMAYHGFGVWSLVAQYLGNSIFDTICLWFIVDWRPIKVFSFKRLSKIYDYGWKILVVGLIDTGYNQLRSMVIAKKFSSTELAYYSKGTQFPSLFVSVIEPTINGVIFPSLSICNDNKAEMKSVTRRIIQVSSYILFPLMIGLLVTAEPLVKLLLTDKWLDCVVFIQIGCLAFLLRPLQIINNCLIKASGQSSLLLKLDILKKIIGIVLLIASIPFGVIAIAWSLVIVNIISTLINIYPNRNLINYGYIEQIQDFCSSLVLSVIMGGAIYLLTYLHLSSFLTLLIQIIVGIIIYTFISYITQNQSLLYIKSRLIKH